MGLISRVSSRTYRRSNLGRLFSMSALQLSLNRYGAGPAWDYSRGGLHSENIADYKGAKHWPYPEPIENLTKKVTQHPLFYSEDGSHKRNANMVEGNSQPVTNPNADPNPARQQYRVQLRSAHKYMKHNFMNMFIWNYRFNMHKFSAKKDARDWHPLNPMRHYQTGQLDYKDHRIMRKPYFTVADNWKPVTSEEQNAMKERNEIAGRNRRYYWKLLLNPNMVIDIFAKLLQIHNTLNGTELTLNFGIFSMSDQIDETL